MSLVSQGDAAVMLIRNTALYTLYTQPSSLIKLYPHCCGSLGWETLNGQMQHVIMCYLLSGFLIFVVLSVLSEKTSVPVSGRRDPLNAWRSQYHVWRERERVGSVKSPNMWRNTQFHMNINFFSLDVCIKICKY